ncbi:hypothetical protein Taro_043089 [Colocasia esculenta]|uniref:Disease resistance N-terminal domain-containing protein n=1 Tax=Colocasia esculenta TaxID=4460 RepID=A0A843WK44_COLES|nr:hypothetical protein [Colocasia esculenta]
MENALRSSVTLAVQKFAAHIGSSPPAASTPAGCDAETIHVKAQWLIRMLAWVRATLDDAEDMDPTDESIRRWLRDLQGVADAAEDVLDEFPQEAMRLGFMGDDAVDRGVGPQHPVGLPRQGKKTKKRKMLDQVRRSSSHTPPDKILAFLCGVEQRIEQIVSRFMKMEKPEEALEREFSNGQIYAETMTARRTTISATKEPFIFGREKDLATVKQFLISTYNLPYLEDGDCLKLFNQYAFEGRDPNLEIAEDYHLQ